MRNCDYYKTAEDLYYAYCESVENGLTHCSNTNEFAYAEYEEPLPEWCKEWKTLRSVKEHLILGMVYKISTQKKLIWVLSSSGIQQSYPSLDSLLKEWKPVIVTEIETK